MPLSRRSLLRSAGFGTLAAALPPGARLSFAGTGSTSPNIVVFALMRGAMDGLNLVGPSDDADLIAARPADLRLLSSGTGAALALPNGPSKNDWRLHPSAPELKALYDSGNLAFVHASGVPMNSRSHFQMQALLERGITDPTALARTNGWIAQYALSTGIASSTFAIVSGVPTPPASMSGDSSAISMSNAAQFTLGSADRTAFLQNAYANAGGTVAPQGRTAVAAVTAFQLANKNFTPPPSSTYGTDSLGQGLSVVAEMIKLGVGLKVAEVEYTNWDTHVSQPARFASSVSILSKALGAFYNDISAYTKNVTVVVMSEFGRRVKSNANDGTDHGHGNVMLILGGAVQGGRIYGNWLGLNPAVLDTGDVPITTDYRAVLSEVITAMRGDLPTTVFPGFVPTKPLGLFVNS